MHHVRETQFEFTIIDVDPTVQVTLRAGLDEPPITEANLSGLGERTNVV